MSKETVYKIELPPTIKKEAMFQLAEAFAQQEATRFAKWVSARYFYTGWKMVFDQEMLYKKRKTVSDKTFTINELYELYLQSKK